MPLFWSWLREGWGGGFLCPGPGQGEGEGYQSQNQNRAPPYSPGQDQDGGTSPSLTHFPPPRPGPGQGYPPALTPSPLETTRYGQDTPRAVRLLRSRRRTVLSFESFLYLCVCVKGTMFYLLRSLTPILQLPKVTTIKVGT